MASDRSEIGGILFLILIALMSTCDSVSDIAKDYHEVHCTAPGPCK